MSAANGALSTQLKAATSNSAYVPTCAQDWRSGRRLNFLTGLMVRNRNVHIMPKDQVLLALSSKHKGMNEDVWEDFTSLCVLPSINWTNELVELALAPGNNPGAGYECVQNVSAVIFDNYSTQHNYAAHHTTDSQGERLDMTNWATASLPLSTLPSTDLSTVSLFRPGFDKYSVVGLCNPHHPQLSQYRRDRWVRSFAAIKGRMYFQRPDYDPGFAIHLTYRKPFWGKLQSSYSDVEYELNEMRNNPAHKHSHFIFVGGDGLAINRVNWTCALNFPKYLMTSPAIIPVQGEHPHGTCHVNHMGWRPYSPLTVPLARAIGHHELKADFTVSDFNDYDHGLCILTEGVAKYFIHLEQSGGPPIAMV